MRKMHYFNITYSCDSDCKFCAANIGIINYGEYTMSPQQFEKQLISENVQNGDLVMISGGEPSLSPYFWEILDICRNYNCQIELTTNGHIFSNMNLAKQLSSYGCINVQLPIFGLAKQHDDLTGHIGGFNKTISALDHFANLVDNQFSVSVKFLLCKATVEGNIQGFNFCYNRYGDIFYYYLNALLVSKKVIQNKQELLEPYSMTLQKLGSFIEHDSILVDTIPLCLLSNQKRNQVLMRQHFDYEKNYSDAKTNYNGMENHLNEKCKRCRVEKYCDKFLPSYIDYFGDEEIKPL